MTAILNQVTMENMVAIGCMVAAGTLTRLCTRGKIDFVSPALT